MVKLADTQDLGSCAEKRAGSSPVIRTKEIPEFLSYIQTDTLVFFIQSTHDATPETYIQSRFYGCYLSFHLHVLPEV